MDRLRAIGRVLFRPDNIVAVVTIVMAASIEVLSLIPLPIPSQTFSQVIIALLALVALTSMIERESRLAQTATKVDLAQTATKVDLAQTGTKVDKVQAGVDEVQQLLHSQQGTILFPKIELGDPRWLMADASEVFVAGAFGVNILTKDPEFWRLWLSSNKRIKVIAQNPWNRGLRDLAIPTHNYNYDSYKRSAEGVIDELKFLRASGPNNMEIKLSDTCPTQGVVIVDGQKGGKRMIVALYLPGCGSADRPTMKLYCERDQVNFKRFYDAYYNYLWEKSNLLASD